MTFLLVDCNNFFASCEQLFNPKLNGKPLAVLSNNDGCVIARSKEAKAIGIEMGEPIFHYRDLVKNGGLIAISSNFSLYMDISHRVMQAIDSFGFDVEIYSIDEAFAHLDTAFEEAEKIAKEIHQRVKKWTGIATSIGVGRTKTLAKLASDIAKKRGPVFSFSSEEGLIAELDKIAVGEIWGVGCQTEKRLFSLGIRKAIDLYRCDACEIKKIFSVALEKTAREIQGTPCIKNCLCDGPKSIMRSRSFTEEIRDLSKLEAIISRFVERAAAKLRRYGSSCSALSVFLATNRFKQDYRFDSAHAETPLPTAHTPDLIAIAKSAIKKIYRERRGYKRAGILIEVKNGFTQEDLFNQHSSKRNLALMEAIDMINAKLKKNAIYFASSGLDKTPDFTLLGRSPCYTTSWKELPIVN